MVLTRQPQTELAKELVREAAPVPHPVSSRRVPTRPGGLDLWQCIADHGRSESCAYPGTRAAQGWGLVSCLQSPQACRWSKRGPVMWGGSAADIEVQSSLLGGRTNLGDLLERSGLEGRGEC